MLPIPGILQARTLESFAISFSKRNYRKKVKSLSHVRLCDPMDCSLPGCSIHGIFQARVLEWVTISFSKSCKNIGSGVGYYLGSGDQWRNNSRKNEGMEPKQKEYPAVDVTGDRSKVRCCKEQYCIRTWNVRSMNQGKLEVVKQEMARVMSTF